MAFLRSTSPTDGEAEILGQEVLLRHPAMGDYQAWAELRAMSRLHLTVWEPQWAQLSARLLDIWASGSRPESQPTLPSRSLAGLGAKGGSTGTNW